MKTQNVNTTYLPIEREVLNRGIVHRDWLAHVFRWAFVLRMIKIGSKILDIGCADGSLANYLRVNRCKPREFVGIDISESHLKKFSKRQLPWVKTIQLDIRNQKLPFPDCYFDIISCFEVIEHFEAKYINFALYEMARVVTDSGFVLLSTPNYNGKNKSKNHVHEYHEEELNNVLSNHFVIIAKYGTFASQQDIYPVLNTCEKKLFDCLKGFYYHHVLALVFAPKYPSQSRNILWVLTKKPKRDSIRKANVV